MSSSPAYNLSIHPPESKHTDYLKTLFLIAWIVVIIGFLITPNVRMSVRILAIIIFTFLTYIGYWLRAINLACIQSGEAGLEICDLWGKFVFVLVAISLAFSTFNLLDRFRSIGSSRAFISESDWRSELLPKKYKKKGFSGPNKSSK